MTFREWLLRLSRPDGICGIELDLNAHRSIEESSLPIITYRSIRQIVPSDRGQVQVWTISHERWPNGTVRIDFVTLDQLDAAEVISHIEIDYAIYDGDVVMVDGRPYDLSTIPPLGTGSELWVTASKKPGDASPYFFNGTPLVEAFKDRIVQFHPHEVTRIRRIKP